ncbi:MAG: SDR family oxidoreductase [Acidobacteria bacterium]|nr:SDR family oxidoreductase [Acidobacteriota bacterium]MCA1627507.1 SDR family oxidoreductase [Acidobacteriota bacterium]
MNTTLITGASSGIGAAFARKLAQRGRNVLLVARSEDKLIALCNELGRLSGIRAQYVVMDLTEPDAPARLFEETKERALEIDMLVNNAGFGSMGDFLKLELTRELEMIDLNVKSLVELTNRFLLPMRERRQGVIINVASTAGFQAVPYMATYAATKAFVLSFSEALWEENRPFGIHVLALCPGVTDTNFFEAARIGRPPMRTVQTAEEVVGAALRGLKRRKSTVISGWTNWLTVGAERFVPRSVVIKVAAKALRSHLHKGGGIQ